MSIYRMCSCRLTAVALMFSCIAGNAESAPALVRTPAANPSAMNTTAPETVQSANDRNGESSPILDAADSLYDAFIAGAPEAFERKQWKYLSRDYFAAAPLPGLSRQCAHGSEQKILSGPGSIPLVRFMRHPAHGLLLVTVTACDTELQVSFWRYSNDSPREMVGSPRRIDVGNRTRTPAVFVGDSASTCLAVALPSQRLSLFRLDPDNFETVFCDTLPDKKTGDPDAVPTFVHGYQAARFGCFAIRPGKSAHGESGLLKIYFWDGSRCRAIPIPGVCDGAITANEVHQAQWIENDGRGTPRSAELLVARRYIDEYDLFPAVYRFDGDSWNHVSRERMEIARTYLQTERDIRMFSILYDTVHHAYPALIADTLAIIEKTTRFGKKPPAGPLLNEMMVLSVYRHVTGDSEGAIKMIRQLNFPFLPNDKPLFTAVFQLSAVKAMLVSAGELSSARFADTLLNYAGEIWSLGWGKQMAPRPMPPAPLSFQEPRLNAYITQLWADALEEMEKERIRRSEYNRLIREKRQAYKKLQSLVRRVNTSHSPGNVTRMYDYFRNQFSLYNTPFFLLSMRDSDLNRALSEYADTTIPAFLGRCAHTGVLSTDVQTGLLMHYCTPKHPAALEKAGMAWDTTDYPGTAWMLTVGLALGDSSALAILDNLAARSDTAAHELILRAMEPSWCLRPVAPACAFAFETLWRRRPTIETLVLLIPGLLHHALFAPGPHGMEFMRRARELVDSTASPEPVLAFRALEIVNLSQVLTWTDGNTLKKLLNQSGLQQDTLFAVLLESLSSIIAGEGSDFRDILRILPDGGPWLITWALKRGAFEPYRELLLKMMLGADIEGYDSLMTPVIHSGNGRISGINTLDFCYILRLGSGQSRRRLLNILESDRNFQAGAALVRLSLATSQKEARHIIKELPLFDPDTLDIEKGYGIDWPINDYLMVIRNPFVGNIQWESIFFFRSFSSVMATKDWFYTLLVRQFRNSRRATEIVDMYEKKRYPLEFACDILKIRDLERMLEYTISEMQSDTRLSYQYPIMEKVLARRLLDEKKNAMVLRFALTP